MTDFDIQSQGGGRWMVAWKNAHPFLRLNETGAQIQLPGSPHLVKTSELGQRHRLIILGERMCGVGAALRWMFESFDREGHLAVLVDSVALAPSWSRSTQAPLRADTAAILTGPLHQAHLDSLGTLESLPDGKRLKLLVRLREVFGNRPDEEPVRILASKLRALCEPADSRIDLVLGGSQLAVFEDLTYNSPLMGISTALRIAPFGLDVIRALCEKNSCPISEETAIRLADLTGRHPSLLEFALSQMRTAGQKPDPQALIKNVHAMLRKSPPLGVEMWQKQLASLLVRFPELLPRMEAYAQGQSLAVSDPVNFPPPAIDRHLLAAGWVALDRTGDRWGIRSPLHALWARPVLDQMRGRP